MAYFSIRPTSWDAVRRRGWSAAPARKAHHPLKGIQTSITRLSRGHFSVRVVRSERRLTTTSRHFVPTLTRGHISTHSYAVLNLRVSLLKYGSAFEGPFRRQNTAQQLSKCYHSHSFPPGTFLLRYSQMSTSFTARDISLVRFPGCTAQCRTAY